MYLHMVTLYRKDNVSINHKTGAVTKRLTKMSTEFHYLGPILKLPYKQIQRYDSTI